MQPRFRIFLPMRAILIDDEKNCSDLLSHLLAENCPDLQIAGVFNDSQQGVKAIRELQPDVVFLDIEMPQLNGFGVLNEVRDQKFEVIFTTAHDEYAIQAIRFSALDYLMKPIQPQELKTAVERLLTKNENQNIKMQLDLLLQQVQRPKPQLDRIALATSEGMEVVDVKDILYCEAQSNYTSIYFRNGRKLLVSKTLKQISALLKDHLFYRVHQSYLVNLAYVKKFVRSGGGYLILEGEETVNVAQSRREGLLRRLQGE